jgi:hypothetical protein
MKRSKMKDKKTPEKKRNYVNTTENPTLECNGECFVYLSSLLFSFPLSCNYRTDMYK